MRPGRTEHETAHVHSLEPWILEREEVVVEGANRCHGTPLHAFVERVDDAVFEVLLARVSGDDRVTLFIRELFMPPSRDVHGGTRLQRGGLGVVWNAIAVHTFCASAWSIP